MEFHVVGNMVLSLMFLSFYYLMKELNYFRQFMDMSVSVCLCLYVYGCASACVPFAKNGFKIDID